MKKEKVRKRNRYLILFSSLEEEKEFLLENLSMLVSSGMDVALALEAIQKELKSRAVRGMVEDLKQNVAEGNPLWQSLEESGLFPQNVISLVRLGEQSGQLPKNLKAIALRERKERSFRSKVRSAMLYPVFVFTLTLTIGVGIAWFLLPKLATVFSSLDLQLPLITRILIATGIFLKAHGAVAVPAFALFSGMLFYFVFFFRPTKFIGEHLLFVLPAARNLIRQIELSRFGYVLATLVDSGLTLTEAIGSLRDATGFSIYRKFYQHILDNISEGNSFQESFATFRKSEKLIPASVQQMIGFAEQSGNLVPTFRAIGENYEEKVETATKDLATLLEPVLLVIVWLGVVGVALAVILPIYSLLGGLSEKNNPSASAPAPAAQEETVLVPAAEEVVPAAEPAAEEIEAEAPAENAVPESPKIMIKIQKTETGFLNVRDLPSQNGSKVIARVKPGEQYELVAEQEGWFQIRVSEAVVGWISTKYAEKVSIQ